MTLARLSTAALTALALSLAPMITAPSAFAEPQPAPADPSTPTATDPDKPLVPAPAHPGSIIDTAALPLDATAHWQPVTAWTWNSPWLTGVEICSPFGKPDPAGVTARDGKTTFAPSGDTQHTVLIPGEGGTTAGWTGTLSFTPYASREDGIGALNSYKRYLDACPLLNTEAKTQNDGGVARNDPTLGHGLLVTDGFYLSTFIAVLPEGLIELAFHQNTATPQVGMSYDPSSVFAALRGATVRGPQIAFPEPQPWQQETAPLVGDTTDTADNASPQAPR